MVNIKVAVRIRPISTRESKNSGSSVVVYTEQNKISLTNLKVPLNKAGDSRERTRKYGFHYCFDSSDPRSKNYADQAKIYEILGKSLLDDLFAGYNSCLFAYGQSASGKTYTMMGTENEPGLTPRLCKGIFARIDEETNKGNIFDVSVSYLEIYNERVRDLLEPTSSSQHNLRVREHPQLGPYVQGLTHRVCRTLEKLMSYVEEGTRARRTASTTENVNSSRSHTLLTIFLSSETTRTDRLVEESIKRKKVAKRYKEVASTSWKHNLDYVPKYGSKLHLVDLAGSETAQNCGGVHRLKESANINKSLVALGNVISALIGRTSTVTSTNKRYIPYRDSSLTWLLKDALGGNATTIMLATISPASRNYNETAHTLRFAQRAHSVVNKPVVNEDPMARTIRELKAEIAWLKSLLLEKNVELDTKSFSYSEQRESINYDMTRRMARTMENGTSKNKRTMLRSVDDRNLPSTIKRINSSENIAIRNSDLVNPTIRKSGSYEYLDGKTGTLRTGYSYNRAKTSELEYEEKELAGEINEAVFVDIPTLVAVLIKPDNTFDDNNPSSTQIEEIYSEEMQEYPIEQNFIAECDRSEAGQETDATSHPRKGKLTSNEYEPEESHFDSVPSNIVDTVKRCNKSNDTKDRSDPCNVIDSSERTDKAAKFYQQNAINVTTSVTSSTNLYTLSRRFGSAEILEKKRDRLGTLERSHTSLEKQATVPEETDGRYNEDSKNSVYANLWKDATKSDSRSHLQRAGSNESDKTVKDNASTLGTSKVRNNAARKPSLESLKRKTSKDSSSSSSKDEQILVSSLANDRTIRRKDSLDHSAFTRTHTPVQRVKRAEIVAAVTERLYSSRKQVEETAASVTGSTSTSTTSTSTMPSAASTSDVRSPPEATDVKSTMATSAFTTKTKLQEISRKMLAKRRRVNADTQTEQMQTIRMKDSSSSTDESKIVCQDVGILTDEHNDHGTMMDHRLPIIRVKEIATLTDKLKSNVTECKDAGCLVNDLNFYEYGVHFLRDDQKEPSEKSGYYKANKMSSTDSLELCLANNERVDRFDKSTNTTAMVSVERNPIVHMQSRSVADEKEKPSQHFVECCDVVQGRKEATNSSTEQPERNVISLTLPDAINITIETTNFTESKMVLTDETIEEKKISSHKKNISHLKNSESQTDKSSSLYTEGFTTKPSINQTDNKCFRIENIFEDPRNLSRVCTEEVLTIPPKKGALKASVTFTNSLGTCFVPETKECATGMDMGQMLGREWSGERLGDESEGILRRDTRSCVQGERTSSRDKNIENTFRRSTDIWKNWIISFPPTSWQRPRNLLLPVRVEPWTFAWNGTLTPSESGCTAILSSANLRRSSREPTQNSSDLFFSNDLYDKDEASDLLKSPSLIDRINTKGLAEQDYNFSDDSLDYNEENAFSSNKNNNKTEIPEEEEGFENVCPPDVVAHTKRENSMLVGNAHNNDIDSSTCLFEDNQVEFSKKELRKLKTGTSTIVQDYKPLILKQCSINVNQHNNSQETQIDHQEGSPNCENNTFKKRVTFLESEALTKQSREKSPLSQNRNFPKAIIGKKINESNTNHNDFRIVDANNGNCIEDRLEIGNRNSKPFKKENDVENGYNDSNSYNDIDIYRNFIKNCDSLKLKKKMLEEYLNEATAFMHNINSLNEYISNSPNTCKGHQGDEKKKRGNHRRSCAPRNYGNYAKLEDDLIVSDVSDDNFTDESMKENDMIAPTESFEKCLKGLARLEKCIRKANDHDHYLREKYNIVVESTGAKSGLANSSIDSNTNSKTFSNLIQGNGIVPLQEFLIRSEIANSSSERTCKDSSVTRTKRESEDSFEMDHKFYDTNNKIVCDHGELEERKFYRLTNSIPSCHYCYMKNTRTDNLYGQRTYYDTYKLYHSRDNNRNSNNLHHDSVATINESAQQSTNVLTKLPECVVRLEKSLGDIGSSRQTMADAFMRRTRSETSDFINSRSFHRLTTSNIEPYTWKGWRYRPESPRAKCLELLRERRRIVESSRDVRS